MSAQHEDKVLQPMADVVALARRRAPDIAAQFEPFVRQYYELADPEDVASRSVADLYGAAMAHWQLGQKFASGQPRVRVYNPSLEQHGWYCGHTVVEIVNDDMPFLVDSVTMEINRQGLALHSTTGNSGCSAFHNSLLIFFRAMSPTTLKAHGSMTWFC